MPLLFLLLLLLPTLSGVNGMKSEVLIVELAVVAGDGIICTAMLKSENVIGVVLLLAVIVSSEGVVVFKGVIVSEGAMVAVAVVVVNSIVPLCMEFV